MAENRTRPTQKGRIIEQSVSMYVGAEKRVFHGWEDLTVTEHIDTLANAFSFRIPQKFQQVGSDFKLSEGVQVSINVNDEPVLTGRIEQVAIDYSASQKTVTISGRSLAADLIDCVHEGPTEYANMRLDRLAAELIRPFGLKVFLSVIPDVIPKATIKPGDTIFEILNKYATLQGYFWLSTRAGNIRLTRAARARADSKIHEDVNLKSGSIKIDGSKRFSKYTVKGQARGQDNYPGVVSASAIGTAVDNGVGRYRPLLLIAEGSVDSALAKKRAQWEATSRLGRSVEIEVEVQGWQQETGILWGVNQLIHIKSPTLGVNGDFLSTQVTRVRSNSEGTISRIALTRQDAYSPEPVIPKSGPGANSLEGIVALSQRNPKST